MDDIGNEEIEKLLQATPSWITPSLIRKTISVWQPYSTDPITPVDALDMLLRVGGLYDVLYGDAKTRSGSKAGSPDT